MNFVDCFKEPNVCFVDSLYRDKIEKHLARLRKEEREKMQINKIRRTNKIRKERNKIRTDATETICLSFCQHCFDYCSFIIYFEIRKYYASSFVLSQD